ncbi:MAG TPA: hypothetical protein VLD85_13925 [Anaeromyxobacteraceae bacterium]|nr:hypothetical protein [Anaeromyxobacteraceae bacterium]
MRSKVSLALAALAAALSACDGAQTTRPVVAKKQDYGSASIAVRKSSQTFKDDVQCVLVNVTPPGVQGLMWNSDPANPQGDWRFVAQQIPAGAVTITASAYGTSDCTGTPLYQGAPPTVVTVAAEQTISVVLWLQEVTHAPALVNTAPFIQALTAGSTSVSQGVSISLDATVVDPEAVEGGSQTLSYAWTGPGTFTTPDVARTMWTPPSEDGDYELQLAVSDSAGASAVATITIHVAPATGFEAVVHMNGWPQVTSIAATYAQGTTGVPIAFTAVVSDDDDPSLLTYAWDATCGTEGPQTTNPATFTPGAAGPCTVHVKVTDPQGGWGEGSLAFTVGEPPDVVLGPQFLIYWLSPNVMFNPDGQKKAEIAALPVPCCDISGLTFAWTDGGHGGTFAPYTSQYAAPDPSDQWYYPATCATLGGAGTHVIPLTVAVTQTTTQATNSATTDLTVICN